MTCSKRPFQLYQAGDFAAAEKSAQIALAAGESAALLHLLGILQCRRDALAEGTKSLERALALEPANPDIRIHLVRALIDSGRSAEALEQALAPAPGPAAEPLWRVRAEAATAAGAWGEQAIAERQADLAETRRLLAGSPGDPQLLLRQGRLLGTLRCDGEAEAVYRRLLEDDPTNAEAIAELGQIYDRGNRLEALAQLLANANSAGVTDDTLAYLRALEAWRRKSLAESARWIAKADPNRDPVRLFALAARVADASGDCRLAMAAIAAKTAAVPERDRWLRSSLAFRESMRAIAASITPQWAASFVPSRPGERAPPAFLIGFPRSGTTLLDTFLMGHRGVAVLEEMPLMGFVANELGPLQRLAELDDSETEHLRALYFRHLERHVDPNFPGLVVDKMPLNTLCVPLIYRLFPEARIIFAKRHPCDCVLSGLMQNFAMNPAMASFLDPAAAADFYDVTLDIWTKSEAVLPLAVLSVAYEDLVRSPAPILRGLIDFLGLEWRDDLLDHRPAALRRGRISTASYDQVGEPLNDRSAGRWVNYRELLGPGLPLLLQWAGRLGYGVDG